ncbi:cytochrome c maturation protein CcmE [Teredinibacter sp. KSP-S5-2]|uniref:cytochrome c maturation protein CcmE n=1 Tax=Teredinibacter sp. KSP-S5-2 TaxID=3034506 RepID=UPI0029343108|nr:cytochrome c maturation protein CcmE [Teredinibacter sp. KSP-S5-2]WNO07704.1 cytochrome c maturation protein CcmE [Teredinibacter sp. KSP-S5-2]
MHPVRKQRLWIVIFIILGSSLAIGLTVFALRENINLFYPPSKLVNGEAPHGKTIRAGGCVVPGTVERSKENLDVAFKVTDGAEEIVVYYSGLLPDLFAEGEAVVLTGKLEDSGVFTASKVLAKHDENYTPSEVSDTVQVDESYKQGEQHMTVCKGIQYDT